MKITNHHKGPIGLPDGTVLPPGEPTTVASWDQVKNNSVVKGWLAGKIISASASGASPASSPTPPTPSLLGSDILPAQVPLIDGVTVQLGAIVQHAHAASGLSIEDWNKLDGDAREALLAASVQQLTTEAEAQKGEGGSGGSTAGASGADADDDKDQLIARAKALGIQATKTWGVPKLQAAITEAEAQKGER